MKRSFLLVPLALASLTGALPLSACSSEKNHAERAAAPEAPPKYGYDDYEAMEDEEILALPIGHGWPDPGSTTTEQDLADAEAGLQFEWGWSLSDGGSVAKATYTYDDNTSPFHYPKMVKSMVSDLEGGWEPRAWDVSSLGPGPKFAARFKGGPFTEYGGGFGQSLQTTSNPQSLIPPLRYSNLVPSEEFPGNPGPDGTLGAGGAFDLRSWTGVAILVRRGPEGQSTMRIGITERNSAEDLNSSAISTGQYPAPGVKEGQYCARWRVCGCSGTTPCSYVRDRAIGRPEYRCFDPAKGLPADFKEVDYPTCGITRCDEGNTSTVGDPVSNGIDPLFLGRSCSLAVQSDGRSDWFCYNPGQDPLPPAKRERCNNPFSKAFTVTTDWQLIKIPFTELRQADEADVADEMDLASVKQLVVTYGGGWIDFYVANIGFYRKNP